MKALLLGVFLLLGACVLVPGHNDPEAKAWRYLCNVDKTFDCTGIKRPEVVRHDGITKYLRVYGFFFRGEPVVFVRRTPADEDKAQQTLIHEMVHYLQDKTGWGEHGVKYCVWEETAFAIADKWAIKNNRADLVRGPDWRKSYLQCQHYGKG